MSQLIYSLLSRSRRPITYVSPDVSVNTCVQLMIKEDIGAVVVHDGEQLIGIVSERDIVRSFLCKGLDPETTTAGEVVYRDVNILTVDDTIEKAMETITLTKRRHILVSENNIIVAILSIGDLLVSALYDKSRVIEALEDYIRSA
jgi:CBS domain-containing protein